MQPAEDAIASEEASIEIDASPQAVYSLVSSIDRVGEWSPEAVGGRWIGGATGRVGDWFEGQNKSGEREWSRECQVAEADPGRAFTFVVLGMEANCTWWSYEMEPTESGGTQLTERWWIVNKTPAMQEATEEQFKARVALTRSMLPESIARIKKVIEARA